MNIFIFLSNLLQTNYCLQLCVMLCRASDEGISLMAWNDNKTVVIASTCKGQNPVKKVSRFSRQAKGKITIDCPSAVHHYNKSMGGVDLSDAHVSRCRTSIGGKKWYFPIFLYLLDLSVANAWILFKMWQKSNIDLASFRAEIATHLLHLHSKGRRSNTSVATSLRFDKFDHMITHNEKQGRCAVCSKCTNFSCKKCQKCLHPKICFESFHTK